MNEKVQPMYSDLELRAGLAVLDSACQYANEEGMTVRSLGILMKAAVAVAAELKARKCPVSFRARSVFESPGPELQPVGAAESG